MFRQSPAPWYTPQGLRDLLPSASVLLTVGGLLVSLLMAVLPGNPETEDPGDPDTGYVQPAPDVQAGLENIRTDINAALIELRHEEGVPPLVPAPHLQLSAQRLAERSAVAGQQLPSPNNVTMVQHHLPADSASGHAFLEAWLHSADHTAPLIDGRYAFSAVGVAVGHGEVWVAVQLSAE